MKSVKPSKNLSAAMDAEEFDMALFAMGGEMAAMMRREHDGTKAVPYGVLFLCAVAARHAQDEKWANETIDWFLEKTAE